MGRNQNSPLKKQSSSQSNQQREVSVVNSLCEKHEWEKLIDLIDSSSLLRREILVRLEIILFSEKLDDLSWSRLDTSTRDKFRSCFMRNALHSVQLIERIVSYDFPRQWPTFVEELIQSVDMSSNIAWDLLSLAFEVADQIEEAQFDALKLFKLTWRTCTVDSERIRVMQVLIEVWHAEITDIDEIERFIKSLLPFDFPSPELALLFAAITTHFYHCTDRVHDLISLICNLYSDLPYECVFTFWTPVLEAAKNNHALKELVSMYIHSVLEATASHISFTIATQDPGWSVNESTALISYFADCFPESMYKLISDYFQRQAKCSLQLEDDDDIITSLVLVNRFLEAENLPKKYGHLILQLVLPKVFPKDLSISQLPTTVMGCVINLISHSVRFAPDMCLSLDLFPVLQMLVSHEHTNYRAASNILHLIQRWAQHVTGTLLEKDFREHYDFILEVTLNNLEKAEDDEKFFRALESLIEFASTKELKHLENHELVYPLQDFIANANFDEVSAPCEALCALIRKIPKHVLPHKQEIERGLYIQLPLDAKEHREEILIAGSIQATIGRGELWTIATHDRFPPSVRKVVMTLLLLRQVRSSSCPFWYLPKDLHYQIIQCVVSHITVDDCIGIDLNQQELYGYLDLDDESMLQSYLSLTQVLFELDYYSRKIK